MSNFNSRYCWLLLSLFTLVFFITRIDRLGTDAINPDGVNWHYRSEQFVVGLKTGQFEKTYQHYHPGVTLMWIAGPAVEIVKQLYPEESTYNHYNFSVFHFVAKYALVVVQLILSIITIYLLSKIWVSDGFKGFVRSIAVVSLFSFEPFFLGNSRLLHMDVLFTLFLFNGLVLAYLNLLKFRWVMGASAGVFMGLAFLTKSIGVGGILFASLAGGAYVFYRIGFKPALKYFLSLAFPFVATIFALFPALWVEPVSVIKDIFLEGERIGIRDGHGQIILGEYTRDAGYSFYPLVLLMKVSPVVWAGILLLLYVCVIKIRNNIKANSMRLGSALLCLREDKIWTFLFAFFFSYLLVMSVPSKKIDRYMLPLFPFMALSAVLGFEQFRIRYFYRLMILAVLLVIISSCLFHPYQFTYTSPLFGSTDNANKIIAQKPFGIGIPELKEKIIEKYGYYPRVGFIDTKPMRAIYMNSRIFDIRVNGSSDYDLLILGINEEIPEKVLTSGTVFEKDESVYMNGLEYWRIYVKKVD